MFRGAENVFLNDMCYVYLVATPGLWYKGLVNGLGFDKPGHFNVNSNMVF